MRVIVAAALCLLSTPCLLSCCWLSTESYAQNGAPQDNAPDDDYTGRHFLTACQNELAGPANHSIAQVHDAGVCEGYVKALMNVSDVLPPEMHFCIPDGTTAMGAVRVSVDYLQSKPARLNEAFTVLALEAFAQAWPCKRHA